MLAARRRVVQSRTLLPRVGAFTHFGSADGGVNWASETFTTHTCRSGAVGVMLACVSRTGPAPTITSVTWNSTALTQVATASGSGSGRAICWSGGLLRATRGLNTLVVTASASAARGLSGWVFDLYEARSIVLASAAAVQAASTVKSSQDVTITPISPRAVLVAMIAGLDGALHPMTVAGAAWTALDAKSSGTATANDTAVLLATRRASGTTSRTLTGNATGVTSTDDWAGLAFEVRS